MENFGWLLAFSDLAGMSASQCARFESALYARAVQGWQAPSQIVDELNLHSKQLIEFWKIFTGQLAVNDDFVRSLFLRISDDSSQSRLALEALLCCYDQWYAEGQFDKANKLAGTLDTLPKNWFLNFWPKVEWRASQALMHKGFYIAARDESRRVFNDHKRCLDRETQIGLLSVVAISEQALGQYKKAEEALVAQREHVLCTKSKAQELAWERRRLSLLIEQEKFDEVERLSWKLELEPQSPFLSALLSQVKIRMAIARGEYFLAEKLIDSLKAFVNEHSVSQALFNFDEQVLECSRQTKKHSFLERCESAIGQALLKQDNSAECVARFLKTCALIDESRSDEAIREGELCRRIARSFQYRKELARLSTLMACHHSSPDAIRNCQAVLNEIDLPYHSAYFSLWALAKGLKFSIPTLIDIRKDFLKHFWTIYSKDRGEQVSLRDSLGRRKKTFIDLLSEQGFIYFSATKTLLRMSFNFLSIFSLGSRDDAAKLLHLLLVRMNKGVTLEDIHKMQYPKVTYKPIVHEHRCRVLASRSKKMAERYGLVVEWKRELSCYIVSSNLQLALPADSKTLRKSPRRDEIFDLLCKRGEVSTAEFCRLLSISRQALHQHLMPLIERGKVVVTKAGPKSKYSLVIDSKD